MEPVTPDQALAESPARPREEDVPPVSEGSPSAPAPEDAAASPNGESEYRIEDSFNCAIRAPREVFENLIRYLEAPPQHNPGLEELFRRVKRIKESRGE